MLLVPAKKVFYVILRRIYVFLGWTSTKRLQPFLDTGAKSISMYKVFSILLERHSFF